MWALSTMALGSGKAAFQTGLPSDAQWKVWFSGEHWFQPPSSPTCAYPKSSSDVGFPPTLRLRSTIASIVDSMMAWVGAPPKAL